MGTHAGKTGRLWQLKDAKACFSELVRRAMEEGPQHVSVRGQPAAVVLSEAEYRQLTQSRPSIVDHILSGEIWSDDIVETINDPTQKTDREIDV